VRGKDFADQVSCHGMYSPAYRGDPDCAVQDESHVQLMNYCMVHFVHAIQSDAFSVYLLS
jgi:hypothetical protein